MNKITIGKKEFNVEERSINHYDLDFYEDNPRIYSILQSGDNPRTQQEIEDILTTMEHVKQLRLSIEQNGGIIDPIIIIEREEKLIVLEGNSRLAAYRILAKKDPFKWTNIKCLRIDSSITDDDIFTLLGQYHLIGRKDWSVFEQAAYLYRQQKSSNIDIDILAKKVGLKKGEVEQSIKVYKFMLENNDLRPDRWSYYDEYLKNQGIKTYRKTNAEIDDTFVSLVKDDKIKQAIDVRNVLGPIAKSTNNKTAKRLMNEIIRKETTIYDAYDRFDSTGSTGGAYSKLNKFKETIADNEFVKKILSEESVNQGKLTLELKKIKTEIEKILKKIRS